MGCQFNCLHNKGDNCLLHFWRIRWTCLDSIYYLPWKFWLISTTYLRNKEKGVKLWMEVRWNKKKTFIPCNFRLLFQIKTRFGIYSACSSSLFQAQNQELEELNKELRQCNLQQFIQQTGAMVTTPQARSEAESELDQISQELPTHQRNGGQNITQWAGKRRETGELF